MANLIKCPHCNKGGVFANAKKCRWCGVAIEQAPVPIVEPVENPKPETPVELPVEKPKEQHEPVQEKIERQPERRPEESEDGQGSFWEQLFRDEELD